MLEGADLRNWAGERIGPSETATILSLDRGFKSRPAYTIPQLAKLELTFGKEEWKLVSGWSRYLVSTFGRIQNRHTRHILRWLPTYNKQGTCYWRVCLYRKRAHDKRERKLFLVHRVVAFNWLDVPDNPDEMDVHHRDHNPCHNWMWNCEWATRSQNIQYNYDLPPEPTPAPF